MFSCQYSKIVEIFVSRIVIVKLFPNLLYLAPLFASLFLRFGVRQSPPVFCVKLPRWIGGIPLSQLFEVVLEIYYLRLTVEQVLVVESLESFQDGKFLIFGHQMCDFGVSVHVFAFS